MYQILIKSLENCKDLFPEPAPMNEIFLRFRKADQDCDLGQFQALLRGARTLLNADGVQPWAATCKNLDV